MERLVFILIILTAVFKKFETWIKKNQVIYWKTEAKYKTMLCYCFKCENNTESKETRVAKANKGKLIYFYQSVQYVIV